MRKTWLKILAVMAIMFVGACATAPEPAEVQQPVQQVQPLPVQPPMMVQQPVVIQAPIVYEIRGKQARVDGVVIYLQGRGVSAVARPTAEEAMGTLSGKPWPGVNVVRQGESGGEGIWVPVSDAALKRGLCSDQKNLLDSLPRTKTETQYRQQVIATNQFPLSGCQDLPFERRGFWAAIPVGSTCAEVKYKGSYYKITLTDVKDAVCVPLDCYPESRYPTAAELSARWGGNWVLLQPTWSEPYGDGGRIATIQVWKKQ